MRDLLPPRVEDRPPMIPNEEAAAEAKQCRRRGRGGLVVFVLIVALVMVAVAFYQEEIGYFFQLQAWNPGKPAQTVTQFLKAGREGNRKEADRYIDPNLFHPLEEKGRFVGYQIGTTVGNLEYRFSELAGSGEIRPRKSELVFKGNGAAMVTVPDAAGKPVDYRLVMQGGAWQISEIRGGRVKR
jgi:hypothetical protein